MDNITEKIRIACKRLNVLEDKKNSFIITRFNLKLYAKDKENNPGLTSEWLSDRFVLFEQYCLPSIIKQTRQCFYWICFSFWMY